MRTHWCADPKRRRALKVFAQTKIDDLRDSNSVTERSCSLSTWSGMVMRLTVNWTRSECVHLQRHGRRLYDTVLGLEIAVAVASSVHVHHLQTVSVTLATQLLRH